MTCNALPCKVLSAVAIPATIGTFLLVSHADAQTPAPGAAPELPTLPFDFRIGVISNSAQRWVDPGNAKFQNGSVALKGAEGRISGSAGGAGIFGRYLEGNVDKERLAIAEGGIMVGSPEFSVDGSYERRTTPGLDSTFDFAKAGIHSMFHIGGTGVSALFQGAGYIPFRPVKGDHVKRETGWEGETGIVYLAPRVPVYAQLGYRFEHFAVRAQSENVGAITLSAGIWFTGH